MTHSSTHDISNWPEQGHGHTGSRVALLEAFEIPMIILMLITVCARLYSRKTIQKTFELDDWVMGVAAFLAFALSLANLVSTRFGTGYHMWEDDLVNASRVSKVALLVQALWGPAVSLAKISICLTYLRTFSGRRNRIFNYVMIPFLSAYALTTVFTTLFQCLPIQAYWNDDVKGKCFNVEAAVDALAALNTMADFLVFLRPTPILWNNGFSTGQRAALFFLFLLGLGVCITGICRIWYSSVFFDSDDMSWHGAIIYVLCTVELNLAIMCGCLLDARHLFIKIVQKFSSPRTHNAPPDSINPSSPVIEPVEEKCAAEDSVDIGAPLQQTVSAASQRTSASTPAFIGAPLKQTASAVSKISNASTPAAIRPALRQTSSLFSKRPPTERSISAPSRADKKAAWERSLPAWEDFEKNSVLIEQDRVERITTQDTHRSNTSNFTVISRTMSNQPDMGKIEEVPERRPDG